MKANRRVLSHLELMIFFENLGLLLSSGLTVEDSLKLMINESVTQKESAFLTELHNELSSAYVLSTAMDGLGIFPPYTVNMIRLAERSGNLDTVCTTLVDYYEQENRRVAQIKSAVTNPFILVCIITIVVAFLVNAVLPIFSGIYAQMGVDITANTLVQVALTIGSVAMWTVLTLLVLVILGFMFNMTKAGKRFFASVAEWAPVTRTINKTMSMARFTSTFSLLLTSGDDLPMALSMASTVCPSRGVRSRLEQCHIEVLAGGALADVLIGSGLFSPTHVGMIKSGVRSGSTPRVMGRLSAIYEQESTQVLAGFLSLIEPLLISLLSIIIGVILLCIMLPLIGILSSFG
ncbi:MAG: type II secretion system F family protein [Peptococcaceae bacterium]|nr:type II secretion system F family protein [Peptococcaceae bacterium]